MKRKKRDGKKSLMLREGNKELLNSDNKLSRLKLYSLKFYQGPCDVNNNAFVKAVAGINLQKHFTYFIGTF